MLRTNETHSHVVVAHNSLANQGLSLRTDYAGGIFEPYCLVANNALRYVVWTGTASSAVAIKDNHIYAGESAPTYASGTSAGGSAESLFVDPANGDFTPAGALLTNLKSSRLIYNRLHRSRATLSCTGAQS
ncbi:hypothetical protein B2G71_22210 [Novosphingobium sp. PC22D]|uniref:hypothetical protein n=1 Tax=Novosphingobium sp. PC22D TaxID=1962403 RepID=UPI000BF173FA|nr:hypothetical protein [Novosphingobium sp. PC22D]PEQ10474.1 hypothetical protein B2G71_22210 [Novosphingobium sp. PC22D]